MQSVGEVVVTFLQCGAGTTGATRLRLDHVVDPEHGLWIAAHTPFLWVFGVCRYAFFSDEYFTCFELDVVAHWRSST